jgi:hypothetical protein
MAVNQLRQFLEFNNLKKKMEDKFVGYFCSLIKKERDGKQIPREKTNGVLELFEATYLDYDCDI